LTYSGPKDGVHLKDQVPLIYEITSFLIDSGADPFSENNGGLSAYSYAESFNNGQLLEILMNIEDIF